MRISDWSSDVCSSDLASLPRCAGEQVGDARRDRADAGCDVALVLAQIFGGYADDAARVGHIVGNIGDVAVEQQVGDLGTGELVVRGAADEARLEPADAVPVERAAERARGESGSASCRERVCQ